MNQTARSDIVTVELNEYGELREMLGRIDARTTATDSKVDGLAAQHQEIARKLSDSTGSIYATMEDRFVSQKTHDAQMAALRTWLKYITGGLGSVALVMLGAIVTFGLNKF